MFTELDGFTEAPGEAHFILITKNMRKLSRTAVSICCSDFWNTCLIPCHCYHLVLHCNDHNHSVCFHVLCYLHGQAHPLSVSAESARFMKACNHRKSPWPSNLGPAWLLHSGSFKLAQLLGVSRCSSLFWVNVIRRSGIMVCPHKISESRYSVIQVKKFFCCPLPHIFLSLAAV